MNPQTSIKPRSRAPIGQSRGLGRFLFIIAFTVGTASLGIWQVGRQYEVIARGYDIDRNLFEYRRMLERQKRLHLLLSAYKDPTALQTFAEEELGMRNPGREDELFIPDLGGSTNAVVPTATLPAHGEPALPGGAEGGGR